MLPSTNRSFHQDRPMKFGFEYLNIALKGRAARKHFEDAEIVYNRERIFENWK